MKTKILLPAVCLSLFLASCSVVKDNNFYSQKYTKFKKSNTEVADGQTPVVDRQGTKEVAAAASPENNEQFLPIEASAKSYVPQLEPVAEKRADDKIVLQPVSQNKVTGVPTYAKRFFEKAEPVNERKRKLPSRSWWGFATDAVAVILAIFIPPLGVWYYEKGITTNFWIDIILCICFWIPGIVFALLVVLEVI